jgi:hypothetical protein
MPVAQGLTYDDVKRQLVEQEQLGQAELGMALTLAPDTGRMLVELASAQRETIAAQRETIAMLKAEIERLSGEHIRQRDRYLDIIRKLVERQG